MIRLLVALAGSALLFMPGLLEQFETPKIEWVRAWGLGALGYGLIAGRAGRPSRWGWLDRAVVAWIAVELLTTVLSASPRVSLVGETRQREGLITSLALFGLYFAARDGSTSERRLRIALDVALGLAALVGLYAIAQVAGLDPISWRRAAVYAGGYVRPFGTLGHPNLLGVLCASAAAAGLALALAAGGGVAAPRSPGWLRGGVTALLALAMVLTLSRAAWLGAIAGLALAAALALRGRAVPLTPRVWGVSAIAVALVAAIAVATGAWRLVAQRLAELLAGGGGSGGSRLEIWRSALAAWRDRPLVGQGPDLFEMVFPHFQTAAYWRLEWSGLPFHAHSIYLHTAATRGVAGLLAALGVMAALIAAARAAWLRAASPGPLAAAGGLLVACAVAGAFGALGITGALLVMMALAVLAAAAELPPAEAVAPAPPRKPTKPAKPPRGGRGATPRVPAGGREWAARIAGSLAALASLLWSFTELRASRAGSAAQAFMTSAPARAADASGYAVSLAPHDDRLWRMHAQTLLWLTTVPGAPADAQAAAERAARRAVELAPVRAENRIILARALGAREAQGDPSARVPAEAEYRRSLALAPMDGLALVEYADHESFMGRPGPALEAARRAVALYPGEGPLWAALARAWVAAGEPDSARASLERGLASGWRNPGERAAAERELAALRTPSGARPAPH